MALDVLQGFRDDRGVVSQCAYPHVAVMAQQATDDSSPVIVIDTPVQAAVTTRAGAAADGASVALTSDQLVILLRGDAVFLPQPECPAAHPARFWVRRLLVAVPLQVVAIAQAARCGGSLACAVRAFWFLLAMELHLILTGQYSCLSAPDGSVMRGTESPGLGISKASLYPAPPIGNLAFPDLGSTDESGHLRKGFGDEGATNRNSTLTSLVVALTQSTAMPWPTAAFHCANGLHGPLSWEEVVWDGGASAG